MSNRVLAQTSTLQPPQLRVEAGQHSALIRRLAIDAGGQFLLTAGDDKTARVWRLDTGELLQVLRPPIGDGWEGRLYGAAFSPDGATVAVAGDTGAGFGQPNRIYLFDRANGRMKQAINAGKGPVKRLAWSSDGRYLATCSAKPAEVLVFSIESKGARLGGDALAGDCYGLAFAGSKQLAIAHHGRRLAVYAIEANGLHMSAQTNELSGERPSSVAWSPDQAQLAVGYSDDYASVDVFEAPGEGKIKKLKSLSGREITFGSLGNVTWSRSGQWLYAAGRGDQGKNQFILRRWQTKNWQSTDFTVASNSVFDLAPTPDDGVVFGGGIGQWGSLNGAAEVYKGTSGIADLRGAAALKISPDGMVVQWRFRDGGESSHFDLRQRIVWAGAGKETRGAEISRFGVAVKNWENHLQPVVNGIALKLDAGELSRSLALLPGKAGFILGADRSLRRYDLQGQLTWQITPPGEARAVVPTADGERLVVACSDGSLRWYRSRDGALLLSLAPNPDGVRWVMWQPDGYYDVSPGADRMIGWHVNNGINMAGDFYPLAQFRNLYHRIDIIDRYLGTWDIASARMQADAAITALALKPSAMPPTSIAQALPPVVDLLSPAEVSTSSNKLTLQFRVRSQADAPAEQIRIRVAGVEVDAGTLVDRQKLASGEPVSIDVPLPAHSTSVLVLAGSKLGFSTAAVVRVAYLAPVKMPVVEPGPPAVSPTVAPTAIAVAPVRNDPVAVTPDQPGSNNSRTAKSSSTPVAAFPDTATIINDSLNKLASPETLPDGRPLPRLFLLAIGVSEYSNTAYNLGLPAKDAIDFSNVVLQQRGGKLYKSVDARVLTNKEATRARVLEGLEWLKKNVSARDTAILFLAGHGITLADRSYFFATHDADLKKLGTTAVSNKQITDLITSIRGQRLLFIDTCHAGNALGGNIISTENSYLINDLTAEENAVIVFSSSTGKQLSQENDDWGNGAFTKVVVKGAQGDADFRRTGKITQKALDFYISDEVFKLTRGLQTPLTIIPFGTPDFPLFERFENIQSPDKKF